MDSIAEDKFSNLSIEVASLPRYEEAGLTSLAPNYLLKRNINTLISLLVFSAILAVVYFFLSDFPFYVFLGGGVFLVIIGWSFFTNFQLMKRNGYSLRELDIIYKRGFLFEKTTVVPFDRVQHVSVERSLLDKFLNLSTLKVFTAGGSGSDVNIPGLKPGIATSLKEEISERIARHA
ncbi:PH domain-containing protein [Salinimicrobium gaetbulicola]|uniref:PH domain-containing protein n=1 Tax=Salinimicrobium gaetbulicola TaxID=999702 RepID=A0ABW3ICK2_9FLAO